MHRLFLVLICMVLPSILSANADEGILAYSKGDYAAAKKLLLMHEYSNDEKSRFVDFLLASIAAYDGSLELAKERFERCFKNPPEKNELNMASKFAEFVDANSMFAYEVKWLKPFFEQNPAYLEKDAMLSWRYGRALFETKNLKRANEIFIKIWNENSNKANHVCDMFLFHPELSDFLKNEKSPDGSLAKLRYDLILKRTDAKTINSFKDLPLSLLLYIADHGAKVPSSEIEEKIEEDDGIFARKAYAYLAGLAFEEDNYHVAIGFAAKSIALFHGDLRSASNMHILQGDSYRFQKQYDEALECYLKIGMSRECVGEPAAEALYKCGLTYFEQGEWQKSYDYFERVFLAYGKFDYWSSRSYLYGAKSVLNMGNKKGARNVLNEYMRLSKNRETAVFKEAAYINSQL